MILKHWLRIRKVFLCVIYVIYIFMWKKNIFPQWASKNYYQLKTFKNNPPFSTKQFFNKNIQPQLFIWEIFPNKKYKNLTDFEENTLSSVRKLRNPLLNSTISFFFLIRKNTLAAQYSKVDSSFNYFRYYYTILNRCGFKWMNILSPYHFLEY